MQSLPPFSSVTFPNDDVATINLFQILFKLLRVIAVFEHILFVDVIPYTVDIKLCSFCIKVFEIDLYDVYLLNTSVNNLAQTPSQLRVGYFCHNQKQY